MLNFITKILVFVSFLLAFNQSYGSQVASLYNVEVLVTDSASATRNSAFELAMDEVFIRIAGDSTIMDKLQRPPASRYVRQFSYDLVDEPLVNDEDLLLTHNLKIKFNGTAMEKYLLDNGFPVWDKHRSDMVVWLVVRDGRNEYVLKELDQSQLKTATNTALARRGVPQRWPLYDADDKRLLDVADIRGGFKAPVLEASKRYSNGPALTGSIIWSGTKWQSNWSLIMGAENRHWNMSDPDHERLIDTAIDQVADALGGHYAIYNKTDNLQFVTVQLEMQAVATIEKYRFVENYLASLNIVEKSRPLRIDGDNAVFQVTLRSSEEDFLNLIKNDADFKEVIDEPVVTSPIQGVRELPPGAATEGNGVIKKPEEKVVAPEPVKKIPVYRYKVMK